MKKIAILFLLVLSINAIAQKSFEEGYFVTNSGETVNCLISNILWHNNPVTFEYKLHKNGVLKKKPKNLLTNLGLMMN